MPPSISTYNPPPLNTTYRGAVFADLFNGKEKDYESGLHYYGARYYDCELLTDWLSVDPMADKYPGLSPYAYCAWNLVKLVDPDGRDTINIHLDKGSIEHIKAHGDHNIRFYQGGNLLDSEMIAENKCQFRTQLYVNQIDGNNVSTTYLLCSKSSVGMSIFKKITKLDSNVEWDFYSAKSGLGELSTSGFQDKMIHPSDRYTSTFYDDWNHNHPKNNSDSFYPSYSDQDLARKLRDGGVRCSIYHEGKSMEFGGLIKPQGYITVHKFRELWNQFAR